MNEIKVLAELVNYENEAEDPTQEDIVLVVEDQLDDERANCLTFRFDVGETPVAIHINEKQLDIILDFIGKKVTN